MSEFTVHTIPGSPFARAVLATLEEKGARYRLVPLAPGDTQSREHLTRHPFGRMPAGVRPAYLPGRRPHQGHLTVVLDPGRRVPDAAVARERALDRSRSR